jgi:hypothetical protein
LLNVFNNEKIYYYMLNEYKQFKKILKLLRALYDQRKSLLLWLRILINKCIKFELSSIFDEFCLFSNDNEILMFFYVNDIILTFKTSRKRRRKFNSSIDKHFRHTKFKFIELFSRCAKFAKTRHDLIDKEFIYESVNEELCHKYWI